MSVDIQSLFFAGDRAFIKRGRCAQPGAPLYDELHGNKKKEDEAKAFCEPCPVRAQCLEYALAVVDDGLPDKVLSGVWGAMTGRERAQLRKARKAEKETNEGTEGNE